MEKYCKITGNYKINNDHTIDVIGSVDVNNFNESELPNYIQFNIVTETFNIVWCKNLKKLRGCPKECENFNCSGCTSLKELNGGPKNCSG